MSSRLSLWPAWLTVDRTHAESRLPSFLQPVPSIHVLPTPAQHARRLATLSALLASLALLAGCATPGPPRPPTLHIPEPVKDLSALRVGDAVQLAWTTPSQTTDRLPVRGDLHAEICRHLASTSPVSCLPAIPVHSGPSTFTDALPADLLLPPVGLVTYRIRIVNALNRSAAPSGEALAPSGPALPPVQDLHLLPVARGVVLQWHSAGPAASVELTRTDLTPAPPAPPRPVSPGTPASPRKAASRIPASRATPKDPGFGPQPNRDARLRVEEQPLTSPGAQEGALDTSITEGDTYRYTAQRLRTIAVSGHSLELRSLPSSPETVAARDTFPPRTPSALAAIASPPTAPAQASSPSIDLSWEPDTEPDLAGYFVYRAPVSPAGTPGTFLRLTPDPVAAPAFRDLSAHPDTRYAYQVTAIDRSGNESAPSAPVQETAGGVQAQPPTQP